MKRSIILLFLLMGCICLMFAACGSGETEDAEQETVLQDCPLVYEEDSAGVPLDISIEDFNAVGFDYGDSVDLAFSNGYSMEDIPYYSGYYVDAYEPLLVAYPGTEHVKATINYGEDLWVEAGLSEGDTVTVSLREAGKYLEIQEAMDLRYTNDRDDYASDEVFANFRNVTAGNIKENVLYRSASPCNNKYNRAPYADKLEAEAGVRCIVNMADNDKDIQGYIAADDFDSPYFLERYQNNDVLALNMSMNYLADVFQVTLTEGLNEMAARDGPYLIHCTEGKDRTGFLCILLEALCGASYQEIVDDYMLSYDNYYGITEESDPERYRTIKERNLDVMVQAIVSDETVDITKEDLSGYARDYLLGIGMEEVTITQLKAQLEE